MPMNLFALDGNRVQLLLGMRVRVLPEPQQCSREARGSVRAIRATSDYGVGWIAFIAARAGSAECACTVARIAAAVRDEVSSGSVKMPLDYNAPIAVPRARYA